MISQFDLFGEPVSIATKQAKHRSPSTNKQKIAIFAETDRYQYKLEGRKLTVLDKRTKQQHQHTMRGFFSTDNPIKSLQHKMTLSAENAGYCLGSFMREFMNRDDMHKECSIVAEQLAEINP